MEIHLIRHGKTLANEKRLYCGSTDLPLSENGRVEIIRLKEQGVYPSADMLFTSGLLRAEQTLEIIYGYVESMVIPQITEFDFGLFEMKSYEELKEDADYQAWITDLTGDVKCPDGDSKMMFERRVADGFNQIINKAEKDAVIICHGGVIVSIMERLMPGERNFYEWQPEPGRGYTLLYDNVSERLKLYKPI
ncbi:MAG: histidine phosphatase family protein [Defluviitaleaceae bacterium]|nr:histidine phosphatase family protein [Defluviitaleaceae bacterium]MCL2836231.1 histidine phosphatase family protein [Defluviitaleaceae bacterium]